MTDNREESMDTSEVSVKGVLQNKEKVTRRHKLVPKSVDSPTVTEKSQKGNLPTKKPRHTYITVKSRFNYTCPPVVLKSLASNKSAAVIIFLHDYGHSGRSWLSIMKKVRKPWMKVILPNANNINITWHDGMEMTSWFDFGGDEYPRVIENATGPGINNATSYIHFLIRREIKRGVPSERIIVAGISQGAVLAIHAGLSFTKRLGGIVALTAWAPYRNSSNENFNLVNKNIPIFQSYVTSMDPFTSKDLCKQSVDLLQNRVSNNVQFKVFNTRTESTPNSGELAAMRDFVAKYLPRIR